MTKQLAYLNSAQKSNQNDIYNLNIRTQLKNLIRMMCNTTEKELENFFFLVGPELGLS